jgi:AmiR/NasT family two-component response regulator
MIRQATNCDMDEAFHRLRAHARNHNEGLTQLAVRIVERTIASGELDEWKKPALS